MVADGGVYRLDPGLWEPQVNAICRTIDGVNRGNRVLLYSPTGSGKTRMAMELFRWAAHYGVNGAFYVNRRLLIPQVEEAFKRAGLECGIRAAGYDDKYEPSAPFQVCSADTEKARVYKGGKWDFHNAGIVVVDEAHIQKTKVMRNIVAYYRNQGAKIVLLTATPVGMGDWADEIVVGGALKEWRDCGALVKVVCKSIQQPDMRRVKRNQTGEYVLNGEKKRVFTQSIVGDVLSYWEKFNDGSPTMLYAPGVAESRWMADQFSTRGHRWVHVDATHCHLDGASRQLTPSLWEDILGQVKDGSIRGMSSRFKAREGIDIPNAGHCVLATPVGSLASYLQIIGRVMRASPGKERAIMQDHGGVYWTHGSPNHDRDWESLWRMKERVASEQHQRRIKEGEIKEPICCPNCFGERLAGSRCPHCHFEHERSKRRVVMEDGEIREVTGSQVPRTRRTEKPDTQKKWNDLYFAFLKNKTKRTFAQMEGLFYQKHGYRPPLGLDNMPKSELDWKLIVHRAEKYKLHGTKDSRFADQEDQYRSTRSATTASP